MDSPLPELRQKTLLLDYQLPAQLDALEQLAGAIEDALPERGDLAPSRRRQRILQ